MLARIVLTVLMIMTSVSRLILYHVSYSMSSMIFTSLTATGHDGCVAAQIV